MVTTRAFVCLVQSMGYNDSKEMNKGLDAKPRFPRQQNIDVQLGYVPIKLFPTPCKTSYSLEQIHRIKSNTKEACALCAVFTSAVLKLSTGKIICELKEKKYIQLPVHKFIN